MSYTEENQKKNWFIEHMTLFFFWLTREPANSFWGAKQQIKPERALKVKVLSRLHGCTIVVHLYVGQSTR